MSENSEGDTGCLPQVISGDPDRSANTSRGSVPYRYDQRLPFDTWPFAYSLNLQCRVGLVDRLSTSSKTRTI
eukprot:scaffold412022_cov22-Prasinocladus_malaysianus.AAC.1